MFIMAFLLELYSSLGMASCPHVNLRTTRFHVFLPTYNAMFCFVDLSWTFFFSEVSLIPPELASGSLGPGIDGCSGVMLKHLGLV